MVISITAAFDGSVQAPLLFVRVTNSKYLPSILTCPDNRRRPPSEHHRRILGQHLVSAGLCRPAALHRRPVGHLRGPGAADAFPAPADGWQYRRVGGAERGRAARRTRAAGRRRQRRHRATGPAAKYMALIQLVWALGSIAGPVIVGAIARPNAWHWMFYLNFSFCGFGLVMVPLTVRLRKAERVTVGRRFRSVDWYGGALFVASVTSLLIALTWGGSTRPWGSIQILVPLCLGVLGIAATIAWKKFGTRQPFLHLALFAHRSGIAVNPCAFI